MVAWFAAFSICAVAMTVAMVRFLMALVDPEPSSARRTAWGLAYAFAWVGLAYFINRIPADAPDPNANRQWVTIFGAAGWATATALWLMFWLAIGRSRLRAGDP